ncbi:MAG: hypothetical protein JWN45_1453 [Acidobacteriaceae bacterium]|nr:hypothetical protein [Acidobacteriaceae bacterium]
MKVPPDPRRSRWLLCAVLALAPCAASMHAQDPTVQRRPTAPATEVGSARLEEKFPTQQARALPEPPSMRYAELRRSVPARLVLPRLDSKPYIEEDERQIRNGERRIRGGVMRQVKISPDKDGEWIEVEPGTRVWRLEIVSPEARGLRLHLANVVLGSGSQLFIHDGNASNATDVYQSPNVPRSREIFSSPTRAESITIELVRQGEAQTSGGTLEIVGVGHLYRGVSDPTTIVPAGACNLDASCYPDWDHTGDSVGRTNYVSGQYVYYCSGALINNNSGDFSPLFLTAAHCGIDSTTAASLNILWKYKTISCNGPENYGPSTNGANFLATSAGSDSTLLEITGSLPLGLTWAGWSIATPNVGDAITGIHHPETSYRRISFGNTIADNPSQPQFHAVRFTGGTVEPGSSGSPLFNDKHEIIGQLYGGNASCGTPSGEVIYGKLATSYSLFKDASGNNYLESGLGDDRFGDISSRLLAPVIQTGTTDKLVLRVGHDDWFRVTAPDHYVIRTSIAQSSGFNQIQAELYRNSEPTPVATSNYGSINYTVNGSGDTYYLRLFLPNGAVRDNYALAYSIGEPPVPYVTTYSPYNYNTAADFVFSGFLTANGASGTYWFEYSTEPAFASSQNSPPVTFTPDMNFAPFVRFAPPALAEDTTYYFRLIASNGLTTTKANIASFHTFSGVLTFSPASGLVFATQKIGTTSDPQFLTIANIGQKGLTLNPGSSNFGFILASGCPTTIAPGASCQIAISFKPNYFGFNQTSIFLSSSAGTQYVQLTGTGKGAYAWVWPLCARGAEFGNVIVNLASMPQMLTLQNSGNDVMDLTSIQIGPGFSQTNNCPAFLSAMSTCNFWVSAKPDHSGPYTSVLYLSSFAGGLNEVSLYAVGLDFQMVLNRPSRPSRPTTNVTPSAQSAAYQVTLTSIGPISAPVSLGCSGVPAGVSCQVQPATVNLNGNSVNVSVVVGINRSTAPSRVMRLHRREVKQEDFALKVSATVGGATRSLNIPVTLSRE